MRFNYGFEKYDKEHMARAIGRDLPISKKHAFEICSFIQGKTTEDAKKRLEDAINQERPIPFRKFTNGLGHKAGMAAGRFPVKASEEIKRILESAETNAQFKGLNTSNLIIIHAAANKGATQWHYGRQRRRQMKRSHVEIILTEGKKGKDAAGKTGNKADETKSQPKSKIKEKTIPQKEVKK